MTIASAITAAQGRVADCYTSVNTMGGTLPEVQNLTNLPAAIESIPQGGGGDIILAVNKTGQTLSEDEKVLLRYNLPDVTKIENFTVTAVDSATSGQTYVQPLWFNNTTFCIFAGFNNSSGYIGSLKYTCMGNYWTKEALTGNHQTYGSDSGIAFRWNDDYGIIVGGFGTDKNFSTIDVSGASTAFFSGSSAHSWNRIGKLNNIIINSKYSYGGGHDSGIYIGTSTRLTTGSNTIGHYLDTARKLILYSEGNTAKISLMNDENSTITATYNSGDIGTAAFVGCTGLAEGDYVFFASDKDKEKWNNMSQYNASQSNVYGTVSSSYSVYKIGSDHKLHSLYPDDTLLPFINIDKSLLRFDNRNNCLVIGTTSNVYVLEFNSSTHTWTSLLSNIVLPQNNSGTYIYNATLSPDKRTLAVYAGDSRYYDQNLFIYNIGTGELWNIVDNTLQNYNSLLSFTGVATGNQETIEGVTYDEISIALPGENTVTCSITFEESTVLPDLSIV